MYCTYELKQHCYICCKWDWLIVPLICPKKNILQKIIWKKKKNFDQNSFLFTVERVTKPFFCLGNRSDYFFFFLVFFKLFFSTATVTKQASTVKHSLLILIKATKYYKLVCSSVKYGSSCFVRNTAFLNLM